MKFPITSLFVIAVATAVAQGHGNQAPDAMKALDFLNGSWSGKQNFNNPGSPLIADISVKVHSFAAGRFIEEELHTTMPGAKPTEVHHFISFDPKTKEYHAWWFNDTSNTPSELTGTLNGNQLVLLSHPTNPKAPVMRATYDKVSDTSMNYKLEMKMGETWQELFHNSYHKEG
jgi:hypothetical protein